MRRIFALCSEGQGFTKTAKALNEDGVRPPRHAVVWNRKQKRDRWGVKKYLDRPERD